jgi:fibronectin-binding autotransporter adhesin
MGTVVTALLLPAALHAQPAAPTWNGGGAPDGNWQNAANWGGTAPAAKDFLFFDGTTQLMATNNYATGTVFGSLTFTGAAGSFGLYGNALTLASRVQDPSGNLSGGSITNFSPNAQSINLPLTLGDGVHYLVNGAAGQLNLSGAITRAADATVVFSTNWGVIATTGSGLATDSSYNGGILGGWAVISTGANAGNWATLDAGGNLADYTGYTAFNGGTSFGGTQPGRNVKIQSRSSTAGSLNGTTAGTYDMNTLLWNIGSSNPSGNQTLNIANGQTLRLGTNGGIMTVHGSRTFVVGNGANGVLTAGGPNNNTPGELTLVQPNNNGGQLQINSTLTDNGTGPVTVNEIGSVNYNFANSYSGGTHIHYGEAYLQSGARLGSGPIYVYPGARADFGGNNSATITNNFFIAGMGFTQANQPGAIKGIYNGTFTGAFTLMGDATIDPNAGSSPNACTFTGPFSGTGTLTIGGTSSGLVEGTATFAGNCSYGGDTTIDATSGNNGGAGLKIATGANNILNNGGVLNLIGNYNSGIASLDLNGTTQTLRGLNTSSGNTANAVVKSSSVGGVLVVGNGNTDSAFGGIIQSGIALTKIGAGTLTLSGQNTYTGDTTVSNGVLALTGSLETGAILVAGSGMFDVSQLGMFNLGNGQVLGGSGAVSGSVSAASGSTISPGFSVGTLTFINDLTLNGGAIGLFDLSAATNGANDQIAVEGNLTLNGGTIQINAATLQPGRYKLITYNGSLGGSAANLSLSYVGEQVIELDDSIAQEIDLVVTTNTITRLTWEGDGVANDWDINTTANWLHSGSPALFNNGAAVVFDDSGSKSPAVNLQGNVQPVSILVSNNTGCYTFSGGGSIGDTATLTKLGSGTLALMEWGGDTSVGGILLGGGSLILSNSSASMAGGITVTNGALTLAHSGTIAGGLTVGNGTASLYDWGTLNGNVTVSNGGTVLLDQASAGTGNTVINSGGSVQVGANDYNGNLPSGSITLNGSLAFNRNDSITVANAISGSGLVNKSGAGTLALNADNSGWSGSAQVLAGTLQMGSANALGNGGSVNLGTNAALDFNSFTLLGKTISAVGSGPTGDGAIVNSSGADVSGLKATYHIVMTGDLTLGGAGRWDLRSGDANPANATLTCSGGQPFNLTKTGPGFIGIVDTSVDTNLADIHVVSGTLDIEGNTTGIGNPTNTLTVESGATLFFYTTTNLLNKRFVMNDGSWFQNSSGATTVVGPVTLNTNASGGAGNVSFNCGGTSLAFSNAISGPGNLLKMNGGNYLFLSATNTYTGNTIVDSGWIGLVGGGSIAASPVLTLNGTAIDATRRTDHTLTLAANQTLNGVSGSVVGLLVVGAGATVSPGTDAQPLSTLTVQSNLIFNAGSTNIMDLATSPTPTNDMIAATSTKATITYGGTLVLNFTPGSLSAGNTFQLFSATNYSGAFSAISPATPGSGLAWDASALLTSGTLAVAVAPVGVTPAITSVTSSGASLVLQGTNNTGFAGGTYCLLSSTNAALPVASWTRVLTNSFGTAGTFSNAIPIDPAKPQCFYRLQLQ